MVPSGTEGERNSESGYDGRRPPRQHNRGDCRMGLNVALIATLALAASAPGPEDAAGWRAQSETLYSQGDYAGALEAAERARQLEPTDPWVRYAWVRALAAVDPDAAQRAMTGIGSGEA